MDFFGSIFYGSPYLLVFHSVGDFSRPFQDTPLVVKCLANKASAHLKIS
jgi:hypothetical protein